LPPERDWVSEEICECIWLSETAKQQVEAENYTKCCIIIVHFHNERMTKDVKEPSRK
jgi:hypothetical protein